MAGPIETTLTIRPVDPVSADVAPMIAAHLAHSWKATPQTSRHTMTVADLAATPGLLFWAVYDGEIAVGCGALRPLGDDRAEVKSVHVAEGARGRGIAHRLMAHLETAARDLGYRALVLETGSDRLPDYAAARALYRRRGYRPCAVLPGYRRDPNSLFLRLDL